MRLHCMDKKNSLCLKTSSSQTVLFLQLPWEQKCANSLVFIVPLEVQWLDGIFGWFFSFPFFFLYLFFLIQTLSLTLKPVLQRQWLGFTVFTQTWTLHRAGIHPENEKIYFWWTGLKVMGYLIWHTIYICIWELSDWRNKDHGVFK